MNKLMLTTLTFLIGVGGTWLIYWLANVHLDHHLVWFIAYLTGWFQMSIFGTNDNLKEYIDAKLK